MTLAFAAWSKDRNILCASTSGGVFSELALSVLARGGIVAGAAYGEGLGVEHKIAYSENDLALLRGVKYVHGTMSKHIYEVLRNALDEGKDVLFSGLPCQCAAVRKMFGSHQHLLIVDLICFGAPSQKLWLKYVAWMEKKHGKRLIDVNPRDKKHGWGRKTHYRYGWDDGTSTSQMSLFDPYSQAFYSGLGFRGCCFQCPFRGIERQSDITLGDLWGAEELCAGVDKDVLKSGISCALVHTKKGLEAIMLRDMGRMELPVDAVASRNPPMTQSPNKPLKWDDFSSDLERMDFNGLMKKYALNVSRFGYVKGRVRSTFSCVVKKVLGVL